METELKPFARWSIDFVGVLPETDTGNRWIIVAVDHMTRWVVAKALNEATAENTAVFIYEEICMKFGCPAEILSDRGSNFMAKVLERYLEKLRIKHLRTSAYHPRTNGKVEKVNESLVLMIEKAVMGAKHKWD